MRKMLVKAPVRSVLAGKTIIKAGAKEIYCSVSAPELQYLPLAARAKFSKYDQRATELRNYDELKEIVKIAHDNGAKVDFAANKPNITNEKFESILIKNIESAVAAGVDSVIIADPALLKKVKSFHWDVSLLTSTFMDITNSGYVQLLKELGAARIIFPHHLTMEEIKRLTVDQDLQYEVFGHFGCAHYNGVCNLCLSNDVEWPCRYQYTVRGKGVNLSECSFMDAVEDCTICYLPELAGANIDSLKIIGRDINYNYIAALTRVYSNALAAYQEGASVKEVREKVGKTLGWDFIYCRQQRCKYSSASKAVNYYT